MIYLHGYRAQPSSIAGRRHAWEMAPSHGPDTGTGLGDTNLRHFYFHAQTETEKKRWHTPDNPSLVSRN